MFNPQPITETYKYDLEKLDRDLDRTKSAVFLGKDAAFFGPLMCSLDFHWATGVETAASDASNFWWDPADFTRCREEGNGEDKSTLMHELWHVARLHTLRMGSRCPDVWNIACDIVINRELQKAGYYVGKDWVLRPEYDHIEMEEDIYDLLQKNGGGGSAGHSGHCQHGQVPVDAKTKQNTLNAAVKAVQSAKIAKQAGSIPGNLETLLKKFLKPIIPWQTVLFNFFNDLLDEDYTWARPARRYTEMYLPSRFEDEGRLEHIIFYEDVSGSITDEQALRFNSEVKYIKDTFQPKKLTLVQFDTQITAEVTLLDTDPFDEIVIVGRGGTSLVPVREHILKHKPTAAVIFSDLYCTPMEEGPECPVIWVAISNKEAKVNFGKLIHIKG